MYNLADILYRSEINDSKKAVEHGSDSITYKQLRESSNRVAEILAKYNVYEEDNIIILLKKSISAIISIFGVLKIGAAYIPIDYTLPLERLCYIAQDSHAKLIITDCIKIEELNGVMTIPMVNIQEELKTDESERNAKKLTSRKDTLNKAAYIIYTSGSTGVPKGVVIPTSSVLTFIDNAANLNLYDSNTRFLNVCPLHFDASVLDIFVTLYCGGTIVLMDKFIWPMQLINMLKDNKITDTLLVPSVINIIITQINKLVTEDFLALKSIWFGGESCSVTNIRKLMSKLEHVKFIHGYGPTESTHSVTVKILDGIPKEGNETIPIGKALRGVKLYVVKEDGNIAKTGEPGELLIGGEQLMLGYCNHEELTGRVLIKSKFDEGLLYKSGDIVYLDENGEYNFISRKDDMVKVGGNLVYTSEVEKVLSTDKRINRCFVLPVKNDLGTKLAAIIVKNMNYELEVEDVRKEIQSKLPDYMIPSVICFINESELKYMASGKIDRKGLLEFL
ncbi:amino acid adenylation domain-containing protein [Anaerocolumna sp. AGMB13025]|uniref:amino acid adenylation domain-containing protein n=1 Tax=Anaerocolumna sp. AGMB13025 TaxID=3039116 RepID=UPI00241D3F96|nr:amino acid adenylation domain-containing protein [Anaerocolumna sp. AGMB13025]WFR56967.1 amino acid adenylation domain-containing protein [Anaerocolumna sp. AGMB13025]